MRKLRKKIKSFIELPFEIKLLFAKAVVISAYVKAMKHFGFFNKIKPYLGQPNVESGIESDEETIIYLRKMQNVLRLCNKYTPWKTECYTLAVTGKILLKHKNISSTVYFGFRKNEDLKYEGHAWLRSGSIIISGRKNMPKYQVQSFFS